MLIAGAGRRGLGGSGGEPWGIWVERKLAEKLARGIRVNEAGLGVGTFGPEGESAIGGEFEGSNMAEGWRIFFEHPIVSVKGDAFDIESADYETPSGVSAGWETFSCGILSIVEGCESIETDREIIF